MASLSINTTLVKENITKARAEITQQNEGLQGIAKDVNFLVSVWDDAAQRTYADKFHTAKEEIEDFNQVLDEYLGFMQNFLEECIRLDRLMAIQLSRVRSSAEYNPGEPSYLEINTDYMRELAGKFKNASDILEDAIVYLNKAIYTGDISERRQINEVLDVAKKRLKDMKENLDKFKSIMEYYAEKYDGLINEYSKSPDQVAEKISNANGDRSGTYVPNDSGRSQTTVADNNNPNSDFYHGVINNSGGWDASGGWDSVGATFPNKRPDFNSVYYTGENPTGRQLAYGKEGRHGASSVDCCFYARARAMEVNGWTKTYGTYTKDESTEAIKAGNRVVRFDTGRGDEMHFVFVEHYDPSTDTVYFSDSNMGGSPATDGQLKSKSFNDFLNYFPNGRYAYTENP